MYAMLTDENRDFVWTKVADPIEQDGEVLIKVRAAALNRADLLQRQGKYPSPAGCPPWMGLEVAGEIVRCGKNVTKWKPGDRVCALLGGGGYAEYVTVSEGMVMPIPAGLTVEEAAALPEAFATCYLNLFIEGRFREGETLFFPAGASGLAGVGIPMAKAFGAYVITSVLDEEKKAAIAPLGADTVIVGDGNEAVAVIEKEAQGGHTIDVAIDCLGGHTIGRALPFVSEGCRWVLISTLDGITTEVPLRALLTKGIELKGSMLRKRSVAEKSAILGELVDRVWPKIASGALRPTVYKVLPMKDVAEAHAILERGENVGKVVLTLG